MADIVGRVRNLTLALALLVLTAALGILISFVVVGFIEGSSWLFANLVGRAGAPWWQVLLLPAVAGLFSGVMCIRTMHKAPPGAADVMRAKLEGLRMISKRDGVLAAIASFTGLALGGSVGAYGPVVHLGSTIAAHIGRLFGDQNVPVCLGAGCAAAIAAAFNAPIAGVIFAHEVILKHYSLRVFAPVAAAALASSWVSRNLLDRGTFLAEVAMESVAQVDLAVFLFIGLACGFLAAGIIRGCLGLNSWRCRQRRVPLWLLPSIGGLAAGAIAVTIDAPMILGGGKPLVDAIATGHFVATGSFAILLVGKLLATFACIGLGMAGGLFSPALVCGALFGHTIGLLVVHWLPDLMSADVLVCALVGMFATAAPVIGAPLAGIMIAIEFSGSYPLAVSVASAIVVSSLVATRLAGGSYYQLQLAAAGVKVATGAEERVLATIRVRERMRIPRADELATLEHVRTVAAEDSLWQVLSGAQGSLGERCAVVDADGTIIGVLVLEAVLLEQMQLNRRFRAEEADQ